MSKLTEHELMKRLDNEFPDVDFHYTECATKGVVATVYFYENKLDEEDEFHSKKNDSEYYQENKK